MLSLHLPVHLTSLLSDSAVLTVDMIDEAGEVVSDDGSTGMKLSGIESMHLHKQRLSPTGRTQSSKDYKAPPPDTIAIVGGMLMSESTEVRKHPALATAAVRVTSTCLSTHI